MDGTRRKTSAAKAVEHMLPKCGGVPGVISIVAGFLASKPADLLEQEMKRLRDNFMHELQTNPEFHSLRGLFAWVHSYLDSCPRHLKKCMLYLSIFPRKTIIQRRRLIRRWIAEGYSKGTDSVTMDKYAEKIFDELAELGVMQPVSKTYNKLKGPVEETIFFPVEVSTLGKGHGRLTTEAIGLHLAIGSTRHDDLIVFQSLDFSRLRSLTVFQRFRSIYVSDRMRVLRVLDLENASDVTDFDLERIGKLLSRLKFLSLRGQRGISKLPESVGGLLQLQTLDIKDTSIVRLPPFITNLRKLQYIRAGTAVAWTDDVISSSDDAQEGSMPSSSKSRTLASCLLKKLVRRGRPHSRRGAVEVPRGFGKLEALQALGAVHANTAYGGEFLDEMVYLHQLKKLRVSGISRKNELVPIFFKKTLESLTLQFEKKNHFVDWRRFIIPNSLRSLKMYGHVMQLPGAIEKHGNLMKLTLEMTTLFTPQVIEVLGSIPNLQTLRLHVNKNQDGQIQFPNENLFRKLHLLHIACNSKLHVRFDDDAMEKLEQLEFHCVEGSEMQFSGLENLVSLKQVWLLMRYFDDTLKEALKQQLVKHPNNPPLKLVPLIHISSSFLNFFLSSPVLSSPSSDY